MIFQVIFMNILTSIMVNTLYRASETETAKLNQLKGRVEMIYDFVWLIDA